VSQGSEEEVRGLSENARVLLHTLIHGGDDWWTVVGDKAARNTALDELLAFQLIEVDLQTRVCRATLRGCASNAKLRATGWAPS
jgi:hypothetical protein